MGVIELCNNQECMNIDISVIHYTHIIKVRKLLQKPEDIYQNLQV